MADLDPEIVAKAQLAEEVVYSLDNATVARFVFDQGVLHLQSLQTNSHALDARATQVVTFLFAAAALAIASLSAKLTLSNTCALASALFFIWGGVIVFRCLRSDGIHLQGAAPAWWQGAVAIEPFGQKEALAWAAKLQQIAIETTCRENEHRGNALNAGLRCGVVGAVLVAASAVLRIAPAVSKLIAQ